MNIFEDSQKNELKENDSIIILDNDTDHIMIGEIFKLNEEYWCRVIWCTNSFEEEYPLDKICNDEKRYRTFKIEMRLMDHNILKGYEIEINGEIITVFGDARDFKCKMNGYCEFQREWDHNICTNPDDCEYKEWTLGFYLNTEEKVFN